MNRRFFFISLLLLYGLSKIISYANPDILWLMHCTQLWLNGQHYYTDFFETNPPLILILNIPAVLLMRLTHLSAATAFVSVMYGVITLVLWMCHGLGRCLYPEQPREGYFLTFLMAVAFLIAPTVGFGEREHFALLFVMPYLLLSAIRLSAVKPVPCWVRLGVAVMAGVGFSIKPYFLPALVFVELLIWGVLAIRLLRDSSAKVGMQKYLKIMLLPLRLENIAILSFMVLYLAFIMIVVPQYFQQILPLTEALYVPFYGPLPWLEVATLVYAWPVLVILGWVGFYGFFIERISFLMMILSLAALGFWIGAIYPGQFWYYHFYPAFALSVILTGLIGRRLWFCLLQNLKWKFVGIAALGGFLLLSLQLAICSFLANEAFKALSPLGSHARSVATHKVMLFAKQYPHARIMLFALTITDRTFFADKAHFDVVGRFPMPLLLPGIVTLEFEHNPKAPEYRRTVIDMERADLERYHPQFIIDSKKAYPVFTTNDTVFKLYPLSFFLSDPQFRRDFQAYHFWGTVDGYDIYALTE